MALKWGIISASKISNDFANALNYLPDNDHQIAAVAASKIEKAEEFARRHKIPVAYSSYQDLVKDESINVVYIGSKNSSHYGLSKLALTFKKHVLCEKPLCLKSEDVKELLLLAKKSKLFLMEAVLSRFFPLYDGLSKLFAANAVGNILYLKADLGVPISLIGTQSDKEKGGGTIFDFGTYALQLAILVFGKNPNSIAAVAHISENGIDENINYILKYDGGKTASLCTHSKVRMDNSAIIYGSDGHIKIKDPFWAPTVISINDGEEIRYSLPAVEGKQYFTHSQGLVYEAMEVHSCITKGLIESPKMTHEETLTISKWQNEICNLIGSKYDI